MAACRASQILNGDTFSHLNGNFQPIKIQRGSQHCNAENEISIVLLGGEKVPEGNQMVLILVKTSVKTTTEEKEIASKNKKLEEKAFGTT